eukprot:COSAG01_NODE_21470_length_900_cov_2.951311_1_plen_215_part_10
MEPEPTTQPDPPDPVEEAFSPQLPTAQQYCRWGISAEGIQAFQRDHRGSIPPDATTSDVCHAVIKPLTTPSGWVDEVTLADKSKRWYSHRYRHTATDCVQDAAPPGTCSYCEKLCTAYAERQGGSSAAPTPAGAFVGKPTVFFSHAWKFRFADVVDAITGFAQRRQAEEGVQPFFWFDCFCVDEHATQTMPQAWWSSTFQDAIKLIGHSCMMFSP